MSYSVTPHPLTPHSFLRRLQQHSTQHRAEGFRELDMHGRVIEERAGPADGFVDDLFGDHQVSWPELLAQTADRAGGEDVRAAETFEREDVRLVGHLRR